MNSRPTPLPQLSGLVAIVIAVTCFMSGDASATSPADLYEPVHLTLFGASEIGSVPAACDVIVHGACLSAAAAPPAQSNQPPQAAGPQRAAQEQQSAQTQLNAEAMDFLVQKVCVDGTGQVERIDPYGCPAGDRLRALNPGESLPYHKHDQPDAAHPDGAQRHDSWPVRDPSGKLLVINPFEYAPFGRFHPWGDGYDIYVVRDGWASVGETRDGGGFSTTFFGRNCTPYNGWVFFSLASLASGHPTDGSTFAPISGDHWEQHGETWPGVCPSGYSLDSLTTWQWIRDYPFGGIGGAPVKPLDTIEVVHGFMRSARFLAQGHLEVFFFTKLYGITRWEVWRPRAQIESGTLDAAQKEAVARAARMCSGAPDVVYQRENFVRAGCRDWSAVNVPAMPEAPPPWVIPDLNLLRNYHFGEGLAQWQRAGHSVDGMPLHWAVRNSTAPRDARSVDDGAGLRYLAVSCGAACGPGERLFQDVPVSAAMTGGTWTFAATARVEEGTGTLALMLEQLDGSGRVIDSRSVEARMSPRSERFGADQSILLSSSFVSATGALVPAPGARALRFSIVPKSGGVFDICDAWLMKGSY
jgi:hypothetical protein